MTAWIVAVAALIVGTIAFAHSRRMARKLAVLEEQYWQLKFDHGELKAKVDPSVPQPPEPKQTFVPLTRLRPPSPPATAGQAPRQTGSDKLG